MEQLRKICLEETVSEAEIILELSFCVLTAHGSVPT